MINDSSLKKFDDSYLFLFSYFFCFHSFLNRIHFWYFNLNFSDLIYLSVQRPTIFGLLKVTSATKRKLLKMCHLKHRLRIFLFHRKIMFPSQDIQVFVILTIPGFTKSVMSRWVLVHEIRCIFEYIFGTTDHEVTKPGQLIDISKLQ